MPHSNIDVLRTFLDSTLPHSLPDDVRCSIQVGLARELIAACALREAGQALDAAGAPSDGQARRNVASQWLALARAWGQTKNAATEAATESEQSLRRAAELNPGHGLPALAQHLQRLKRWDEAANAWRAAIAAEPTEPNAYFGLARVFERLGHPEQALSTYLELVEAVPSARTYLTVAVRLEELAAALPAVATSRQVRIALLGNATLDHLTSYVRVECFRAGLRPTIYQAGFDQVTQEILDPSSGLYTFAPDVLIFAVHASRLFPHLHHDPFDLTVADRRAEIDAGIGTLQGLLEIFTQNSPALVLIHNMVTPQHPALGTLDWRDEMGQGELFAEINRRLAELVRTRYRSVYVVDEDRVQARAGKAQATDARLWLTSRVPWRETVHLGLAREYLRYVKPYRGLNRKCIVLDLDNTLWGGVVGEDGISGLQLGADAPGNAFVAFQRELERLWRRGVLLAVCSKNNIDDALPVFDSHPAMVLRREHIAASRINWQPKATNLREIAAELNIGLDSLVFFDDNPIERAAVRTELPEVLVPELPVDPAQYRAALLELDVFESLALTAEDRQRGRVYAEQAQRRDFEASTRDTSIEDYLAGLDMLVEIAPCGAATLSRIAQLTNKTNQFNLTTCRYSEADILALQAQGSDVFGMRVADRFGDNGLVGVAILHPLQDGSREIDTLLLSCRVMGRGVETALLSYLAQQARSTGASILRGRFQHTAKNEPARPCYARHGFKQVEQLANGSELWELDLAELDVAMPRWLRLQAPELVG
jgi:FkbH-like protein